MGRRLEPDDRRCATVASLTPASLRPSDPALMDTLSRRLAEADRRVRACLAEGLLAAVERQVGPMQHGGGTWLDGQSNCAPVGCGTGGRSADAGIAVPPVGDRPKLLDQMDDAVMAIRAAASRRRA